MIHLYYLFTTSVFLCLSSANTVPFITKCKGEDSLCLKKSTQAAIPLFAQGIPELGIEKMDPLSIKHIDASSSILKLIVDDMVVTGLKNCETKKMERDLAKSKLIVRILCTAGLEGNYEMKGSLLFLPIEGKGKIRGEINKILIKIEGVLAEQEKSNEKYWTIKNWSSKFDLKAKSDLEFENLFNGNELLGRAARELIHSNANDVITEIGPPVVDAIIAKIVDNIKQFFSQVPIKDLVLD